LKSVTGHSAGKTKPTRVRALRDIAEAETGQPWPYLKLMEFLREHSVELIDSQGQPNVELRHLGYKGTEAVSAADTENLISFWIANTGPEAA